LVAGVEFAVDDDDSLYAIQRANSRFYKFNRTGDIICQFGQTPAFYREPVEHPKLEYPRDDKRIEPLLAQWTQLNRIFALRSKSVLLVFQIHTPNEYAIEIYNENGNLLEGGIGSDLDAVARDHRDVLYFAPSSSKREQTDYLTLLPCVIGATQRNTP
jgi:hypothetical protein